MNSNTHMQSVPASPWSFSQSLPSQDGLDSEILLLAPGAEHELPSIARSRAFFTISGSVTVSEESSNHIISADNLVTVPKSRPYVVHNRADTAAKVLVLALPAPRVEWKLFVPGEPDIPTSD